MKTIRSEYARRNLEELIEYVDINREQVKIVSKNAEAIIIDFQTWNGWQKLLEDIENKRLLELAQKRKGSNYVSFDDLITSEGFDFEEIKKFAEKIEIE